MKKRLITGTLAAGLAVSALAGPTLAKVEDERAGDPGCNGRILAVFNGDSGENPDGTPNATNSRGPGFGYARGYFPDGIKPNDAINDFARPHCEGEHPV
jgi:hypothetical protein